MPVEVETEPTRKLGTPRSLLPNKYTGQFDIHSDGKRFLMIKPAAVKAEESIEESVAEVPRKIIIVTNWFEEVKEMVFVD
jgi:hypothetical protein